MANKDYDNYDRREPSRPRSFDRSQEMPEDRLGRVPSYDDAEYPRGKRSYSDREPLNRFPSRGDDLSFADLSSPGGNVTITSPKSFKDVQDMIDKLRRNESIIVNLEEIELESAQRILDFLSGASYAIGGSMRRVKEMHSTFLVTPHGTGITDTNDDRYPR